MAVDSKKWKYRSKTFQLPGTKYRSRSTKPKSGDDKSPSCQFQINNPPICYYNTAQL